MRNRLVLWLVVVAAVTGAPASAAEVHHSLEVTLDPANHRLEVVDGMRLAGAIQPDQGGGYRFLLHAGLAPEVTSRGWGLEPVARGAVADFIGLNASSSAAGHDVPLEGWRLVPSEGAVEPVQLRYRGAIHHELATAGEEYQRSFSETPGIVDERGVFLAGASYWVPTFGDGLVTFELEVRGLVPPWDAVSQGRRVVHDLAVDGIRTTRWLVEQPTEEVCLVAGPWHAWSERVGEVEVFAFLRDPEEGLAHRYLEATRRYLELYQGMLGRFPYPSFALVENFWETGYGMPGFTLLGPQIIRFPWILTSSYPHELLHNWWGNSAYVDYRRGNWCEGLTAYMADHLFAEQRGEGALHRRATLQKYSDFVTTGNDFPLVEFTSRRSAASEAVGYGKSLMLFHMVRRAVGDERFLRSLERFYELNRFRRASFSDLADALAAEAGGDWPGYFEAWTSRVGAPRIEIGEVEVRTTDDPERPFVVRLRLDQTQPGDPFPITVPVALTLAGQTEPMWFETGTCHRRCQVEIPCSARPLRIDVDPAFDVMRRLDPLEVPPALSALFGASSPRFVLPSSAPEPELAAWHELAAAWARPGEPRLVMDSELDRLPEDTVWLLGWQNRWVEALMERLAQHSVSVGGSTVRLGGQELARSQHSLVLVARGTADPASALGWVAADPAGAIAGLGRKLPHYSRYSYLAFRGDEPVNVAKGMWQPVASPLVRNLAGGELPPLALPTRPPLAELPPTFGPEPLRRTVAVLADPAFEGRGLGSDGLEAATTWVAARMAEIGLAPAGDDGYRQSWLVTAGAPEREMRLTNLIGRIPGSDPALAERPVLVMAHLDHLGRGWPDVRAGSSGQVHPGADDNASGVAVLLELAGILAASPPRPRPVLVAAVTGEEAGRLGSRRLLAALAPPVEPYACVNLDTVGRLRDGGKLHALNADSAREWPFIFMGVGHTTGAPVTVVAAPLDSSDQMSCIERGVPAVQLFTGPNPDYHRPSDTVEKIDGEGMAVVAEVAHETVAYLAERREPLTATIGSGTSRAAAERGAARRVSLGTMPDFSHPGPGVRVLEVVPGSAAEAAGIVAGDVVVAIEGAEVSDLRSYSSLLAALEPGVRVTVTVLRGGERLTVTATLGER